MLQEDALSLTVPRQRRRRRRKIEIEAERAAKRRNLMEMVAQLRESHAAAESQSQAIDLTKVLPSARTNTLQLLLSLVISKLNGQTDADQLKSNMVPCSGHASSPQSFPLIGRLPHFPGDKPLPQGSDGAAAASHTLWTQSQWLAGK